MSGTLKLLLARFLCMSKEAGLLQAHACRYLDLQCGCSHAECLEDR